MREDVKTRLYGAAGALATALIAGALQARKLGKNPFALQITATVIFLSWLPYLYRIGFLRRVPPFLSVPLGLVWVASCFGPVFITLIIELFTGHRRPGMSWYNALWRIYAILGLWIAFAMLNERYIRPWWRQNSDRILGPIRVNSVAGQAREIALDKRTATLEAIKARVKNVLNKKKLTERTVERKKEEIEKAKANIKRAESMLERARKTAQQCDKNEKADAEDVVETMTDMLENAVSNEKSLHTDIDRLNIELEDIKLQLETFQQDWTEALHIQNYTDFFR